ncbi:MAG: glnD [Ilumatobacteraceae bacterium]|nr:glnD [Ilumatobacteraceae bacterium]
MKRMVIAHLDGQEIKRSRADLVSRPDLAGRSLARRLARQADAWFDRLAVDLPRGWSLMATGGYAGSALSPGSDIDVVLLHPPKTSDASVRQVAEAIWYPLWDSGVKLSPSAHSTKTLLALAEDDLVTATSILRVRCLAGEPALVAQVQASALEQWRKRSNHWLHKLHEVGEERWARFGEVASLLEPDLKDGRGGLRDHDVLRWALATGREEIAAALESPMDELAAPAEMLLSARCELHRVMGRNTNVLLLEDQDAVAEAMGFADADVFMRRLSGSARAIDWASGRFWRRVQRLITRSGRSTGSRGLPDPIPGVEIVGDEVDVSPLADFADQSLVFRVAAAAARVGAPLSRHALLTLSANVGDAGDRWSDRTRRAFVSLLGSGQQMVSTVEALEQYDLFSLFLPEWRHVRSLPQRNAFHTFTVDRHLLKTVANATELVRDVARPDLLLVAALLHDIGKGYPGDHTEVGLGLVERILPRMGFSEEDAAIIMSLVEHHLLLAETAMRRDLSDARTATNVADAVGDPLRLELLHALTEADSLATGPSAWSAWKETLIDQLVAAVGEQFRGEARTTHVPDVGVRFADLVNLVRQDGQLHTEHEELGDFFVLRVATMDQPGLFARVAGALAMHGVDVLGADVWTSLDEVAVEVFQLVPSPGGPPNFARIHQDLVDVLTGRIDVNARIEARIRTYQRAHRRAIAATPPRLEVLISNDASDSTTMIDVRAPDAPAVLYRLSSALARWGADIRSAKVATLGHEVVDVFYVQPGESGGQLDPSEHDDLREHIKRALVSS